MVLETYMKLCMTEWHYPEKYLFDPKIEKMDAGNGPKTGFFIHFY